VGDNDLVWLMARAMERKDNTRDFVREESIEFGMKYGCNEGVVNLAF
jgi:hypothetical protein